MPNLQTVPRTIVRTYISAARLPLTAAESILKRGENTESWAPTLAFEAAEAEVLQFVGNALNDEELVNQGRLVRAKVAQLKQAAELEVVAAEKRATADAEFQQRKQADEAARRRIEQTADQREAAVARESAAKKRQADERARKQAEAARKVEAAQKKQITKKERAARSTRVVAEQKAIAEERKALRAEERVLDLDAALRTTKTARKAK